VSDLWTAGAEQGWFELAAGTAGFAMKSISTLFDAASGLSHRHAASRAGRDVSAD
jgi:hypothetical protein